MQEESKGSHGLSCGCGHCEEKSEAVSNVKGRGLSFFFAAYWKEMLGILLGLCLWALGRFLTVSNTVRIALFSLAALVVGYVVLIEFVKGVIKLRFFDENTLMVIASVCAFVLGEYSEGALIMILFNIGEWLERVATDNSRRKVAGLAKLRCETVRLITKGGIVDVNPAEVPVGSLIQVKKGDRIAIDGVLLDRNAVIDMKSITGESKYAEIGFGGKLLSGGINVGEAIVVKTEKTYQNSTAQKIVELVENSLSRKAKSQKLISVFAKYYTPIIVALGVIIAVVPPLFDAFNFVKWIYKALSFIVISCPCALVISVPLGYFVGIGALAKRGVLVKGSCYLEILAQAKAVVFDKTGTLTNGEFWLDKISVYNDFCEDTVKNYAFSLETLSNHPIARAIIQLKNQAQLCTVENVAEISGKGIVGEIDGKRVALGNATLMRDYDVSVGKNDYNGSVLYLAVDKVLAAEYYLQDTVKESSKKGIDCLKRMGVDNLAVLSGDSADIVKSVSENLGITDYYAELLPEQKLERLEMIKERVVGKVVFAGDGINDSPVLACADVGVAMGGLGSEIAIETADVVIMDDDVSKIGVSIKHAKKVKRIILENIIGSIFIKLAIMVLSVVINLPIWVALFADVGVMLLAVLNSLLSSRVKKIK